MSKLSNVVKNVKNMKITEKSKLWLIIPACILAVAVIFMSVFAILRQGPLNLGIDFTGGTILDIRLGTDLNDSNYNDTVKAITGVLNKNGLKSSEPQKSDDDAFAAISIRYTNEINGKTASNTELKDMRDKVEAEIYAAVGKVIPNLADKTDYIFIEAVGATASSEIWLNALFCVLIAAVLILIYIAIRFKWDTGIAAVAALMHDILIMVAFMAIFRIQINAPFIAAMITIVGYSINNTIVVFDRIRENQKKVTLGTLSYHEMADLSIKQTFKRSLYTTFTTLITTVLLFIIGVSSIREFTFPIIVGLISGTYSSICIAPSIWTMFQYHKDKKKKAKTYEGKVAASIEK